MFSSSGFCSGTESSLTDVSIAEARHLLAQSELIESEKNVNTLSAKFNYIFGVYPNKPMEKDVNYVILLLFTISSKNQKPFYTPSGFLYRKV